VLVIVLANADVIAPEPSANDNAPPVLLTVNPPAPAFKLPDCVIPPLDVNSTIFPDTTPNVCLPDATSTLPVALISPSSTSLVKFVTVTVPLAGVVCVALNAPVFTVPALFVIDIAPLLAVIELISDAPVPVPFWLTPDAVIVTPDADWILFVFNSPAAPIVKFVAPVELNVPVLLPHLHLFLHRYLGLLLNHLIYYPLLLLLQLVDSLLLRCLLHLNFLH